MISVHSVNPKAFSLALKDQCLFPFVLVDLESLHSDWLTGVVHEAMHHTFHSQEKQLNPMYITIK